LQQQDQPHNNKKVRHGHRYFQRGGAFQSAFYFVEERAKDALLICVVMNYKSIVFVFRFWFAFAFFPKANR